MKTFTSDSSHKINIPWIQKRLQRVLHKFEIKLPPLLVRSLIVSLDESFLKILKGNFREREKSFSK
jgi:hypothetical protein